MKFTLFLNISKLLKLEKHDIQIVVQKKMKKYLSIDIWHNIILKLKMAKRSHSIFEEPMTDNNNKKFKTNNAQFSWLNESQVTMVKMDALLPRSMSQNVILCSETTDDEYITCNNQINCMISENTLEKRIDVIDNKLVSINNKIDELYWKLETNTKEILLLLRDLKQQCVNKKTNIQDATPWMSYIS